MQLVPNKGFVQTESYVRKNKHIQLDLSAHTKNDSKLEKTPVAISVGSISAVSRVRSLMSAGSFPEQRLVNRAYDKRLG